MAMLTTMTRSLLRVGDSTWKPRVRQASRSWSPMSADDPLGFAEMVPLETAARDVEGDHAVLLHCVNVFERSRGLGRALVAEVSRRAEAQGRGVVVDACSDVWGFMPEEFFLRLGFDVAEARGRRRLMYRSLPPEARQPHYLEPRYDPPPAAGVQVLVDVFFTPLCSGRLSEEVAVMRRASAPYGDRVLVREWDASDPAGFNSAPMG